MSGKHRARWYTPWRLLIGELAYQAGRRGVSHRLPKMPNPTPQLTVAGLARAATGDTTPPKGTK